MLGMKGVVWVSSMVWVGERGLGGRTGEVVLMKGVVRGELNCMGKRGGGGGGGAESDSCSRGTMKQGVQRLCLLPV